MLTKDMIENWNPTARIRTDEDGNIVWLMKEVQEITTLSVGSIYRYDDQGIFPKRRKITGIGTVWIASEVKEWVMARIKRIARRKAKRSKKIQIRKPDSQNIKHITQTTKEPQMNEQAIAMGLTSVEEVQAIANKQACDERDQREQPAIVKTSNKPANPNPIGNYLLNEAGDFITVKDGKFAVCKIGGILKSFMTHTDRCATLNEDEKILLQYLLKKVME